MDTNEMIERYVNEVGQHLPRKTRADIEMELRSLLLDMLDEQSAGQPTPKIAAAMLLGFGHPEEIAAQYRPEAFLIGPTLFPTYQVVITIALSIIGVLHLLGLGFVVWQSSGAEFVDQSLSFIFSFGRATIISVGLITLIFAAVERAAIESLVRPKEEKSWDPTQLPPVKDPNRIDRGEMVVGILFAVAFISWLNFFPNWFGGADFGENELGISTLFTAQFLQLIPLFTASLLLDVVLKTAVVIRGRWQRATRWLELATLSFGLYVVYRAFSLEAISPVPFFATGAKVVLAIILIVAIVEIGVKLFRLLGNGRQADHLIKKFKVNVG